ncbi:hypothetical protein L3Q82_002666 [Scortum barcoo]|uniref:Uncharacterized protein n=1 Tax=Scortum barcoo TaxID=214431 RepID=A0ACB8VW33_9TELE|nr:hypothetical protein L3Q82_002666 [Scortum barcoo]
MVALSRCTVTFLDGRKTVAGALPVSVSTWPADPLLSRCGEAVARKQQVVKHVTPSGQVTLMYLGSGAESEHVWSQTKGEKEKPAVPAIIMGNVRSLGNKTDELAALVKTQRENRECSIFCFSETWLHSHIPDSSVEIPGYSLVRGDRDCSKSRKKKGGGLALYVSERWCSPGHVFVKERFCTPDIELLAVGMRPVLFTEGVHVYRCYRCLHSPVS